jgi:hypothetical protein
MNWDQIVKGQTIFHGRQEWMGDKANDARNAGWRILLIVF